MRTREAPIPRERTARSGRHGGTGFAGSLALHLVLLMAVLLAVSKPDPPPPEEKRIAVEILDPGQFEAIAGPFASSLPPALPEGLGLPASPPDIISFPADLPLPPRSGERIVAQRFLSAATLADPRSAQALAALPLLQSDERIIQLCAIEALAQIAELDPGYDPDMLTAYSMEDIRLTATSIDAPGAAFRSGGKWYGVAFKCRVTAALDAVDGFEFAIGEEIPHERWVAHNLVEGSDPHGQH